MDRGRETDDEATCIVSVMNVATWIVSAISRNCLGSYCYTMIIIVIYICIFSRTYSLITVQLELPLEEIYHLLFASGSALVNRVTV